MGTQERQRAYKVVELATVDEASLERTVNTWVGQGWRLENVQFAMRESSRRPSMAFVFFIRETGPEDGDAPHAAVEAEPEEDPGGVGSSAEGADPVEARARLERLAEHGSTLSYAQAEVEGAPRPRPAVSAWERLRQLAGDDDEDDGR